MIDETTNVHGSIFFLLKKYVNSNFAEGTWDNLIKLSGASGDYEMTQSYPLQEIGLIVAAASQLTGISPQEIQERFGEFLVPDLFKLYADYLRPEWKTFDVLLHTEGVMHGAVRKLNSIANPPVLNVSKVNENLLIIDYYSKRRMGALATGIIKGIAKYFNESEIINIKPMSDPDAERVQIRVEFL
ncbi:MAG TPA: heme NO-binding domain-containing protein [Sphingobacteriaceae bacterium]|nr:heme NO-binding domain-containing protein [Sphingobacteriaceae bacterium]